MTGIEPATPGACRSNPLSYLNLNERRIRTFDLQVSVIVICQAAYCKEILQHSNAIQKHWSGLTQITDNYLSCNCTIL